MEDQGLHPASLFLFGVGYWNAWLRFWKVWILLNIKNVNLAHLFSWCVTIACFIPCSKSYSGGQLMQHLAFLPSFVFCQVWQLLRHILWRRPIGARSPLPDMTVNVPKEECCKVCSGHYLFDRPCTSHKSQKMASYVMIGQGPACSLWCLLAKSQQEFST